MTHVARVWHAKRRLPRHVGLAAALIILCPSPLRPAQHAAAGLGEAENPPPGLLATFLRAHPNAVRREEIVASIDSARDAKASFTAIVARDPLDGSKMAKGLLIRMEDGKTESLVYVDDDTGPDGDSLKEFQERLGYLAGAGKDRELASLRRHAHAGGDGRFSATVSVQNRPGTQPEYCCPRYTVLNAGWYGEKQWEFEGVTMNAPGAVRAPGSVKGHIYCFPEAKLDQVTQAIAQARRFLDAQ